MSQTEVIPIAAIRQYFASGAPISLIRGRFVKLSAGHAGTNSKGSYRIQNGKWKDETGDEIDVQIKDFDDDWGQSYLNTPMEIEAFQSDRGLTGLYAFDDTYKDKTTRKIKITKTAQINWLQGAPQQRQAPPQQQHRQEEPPRRDGYNQRMEEPPPQQHRHQEPDPHPRHQEQYQQRPAPAPEADHYKDAMMDIAKMACLYTKCYDAAASVAWRNYKEHNTIVVSGGIAGMATTFFIQATKQGLHARMPAIAPDKLPKMKGRTVGELMELLQVEIDKRKGGQWQGPTHEQHPEASIPATPPTPPPSQPPAFKSGSMPGPDDDEIPF